MVCVRAQNCSSRLVVIVCIIVCCNLWANVSFYVGCRMSSSSRVAVNCHDQSPLLICLFFICLPCCRCIFVVSVSFVYVQNELFFKFVNFADPGTTYQCTINGPDVHMEVFKRSVIYTCWLIETALDVLINSYHFFPDSACVPYGVSVHGPSDRFLRVPHKRAARTYQWRTSSTRLQPLSQLWIPLTIHTFAVPLSHWHMTTGTSYTACSSCFPQLCMRVCLMCMYIRLTVTGEQSDWPTHVTPRP